MDKSLSKATPDPFFSCFARFLSKSLLTDYPSLPQTDSKTSAVLHAFTKTYMEIPGNTLYVALPARKPRISALRNPAKAVAIKSTNYHF